MISLPIFAVAFTFTATATGVEKGTPIEFFLAGASAIEIGTANFIDPAVTVKVVQGINDWLDAHGCQSVSDIVGQVNA